MGHNSESPDDAAQASIAGLMRDAAGALDGSSYPVGRMNPIVYPVDGGMEDWAYGGSWDTPNVKPCAPTSFGGYPREKTVYNSAVLRAFNILVEAADAKGPPVAKLGTHPLLTDVADTAYAFPLAEVFTPEGPGDGHVPRNDRH
jgi:hypothetical protein